MIPIIRRRTAALRPNRPRARSRQRARPAHRRNASRMPRIQIGDTSGVMICEGTVPGADQDRVPLRTGSRRRAACRSHPWRRRPTPRRRGPPASARCSRHRRRSHHHLNLNVEVQSS